VIVARLSLPRSAALYRWSPPPECFRCPHPWHTATSPLSLARGFFSCAELRVYPECTLGVFTAPTSGFYPMPPRPHRPRRARAFSCAVRRLVKRCVLCWIRLKASARYLGQPGQRGAGEDARRLILHASAEKSFDALRFAGPWFFRHLLAIAISHRQTEFRPARGARRRIRFPVGS
jgi:hypothetical protein